MVPKHSLFQTHRALIILHTSLALHIEALPNSDSQSTVFFHENGSSLILQRTIPKRNSWADILMNSRAKYAGPSNNKFRVNENKRAKLITARCTISQKDQTLITIITFIIFKIMLTCVIKHRLHHSFHTTVINLSVIPFQRSDHQCNKISLLFRNKTSPPIKL